MTIHYSPEMSLREKSGNNGVAVSVRVPASTRPVPVLPASGESGVYRNGAKRIFDIVAILLAAPIFLPLMLVLLVAVSRDGGKPIYFQKRVGRDGKVFTMWKLRTMVHNADALLESHLEDDLEARAEWDSTQKLKSDPRVTRFGRFLRKSSLDELPQFWNVLIGEMSLVGPRPMMPSQEALYPGQDYYHLRPGVTGMWQVSERNLSSFADRAKYDTQYNRELSFWTDLKLLLATLRVVWRATGH